MIPFRVSTAAFWPNRISLAWVAAILSSARSLLQRILRARGGGLLIESLALQTHPQVGEISLGLLYLPLEIGRRQVHIRINQYRQNGVGFHLLAGFHGNLDHLAVLQRRDHHD